MKHTAHRYPSHTLLAVIVFLFFFALILIPFQSEVIEFSKAHPYIAPAIIIFWRVLAVVIPPIPGGLLSLAFIPVFGWFWSFVYGMVSVVLGTSIAFLLGRWYKAPLVSQMVPINHLERLEKKLSQQQEFWTFLLVRITTGPLFDFVSYVAGMSKIRFRLFLLVVILAELPTAILYYLTEKGYQTVTGENEYFGLITFGIIVVIYAILSLYKHK